MSCRFVVFPLAFVGLFACGDDESGGGGAATTSGSTSTSASSTTSTTSATSPTTSSTGGGDGGGGGGATSSSAGGGGGGVGAGGGASGDLDLDYCTPLAEVVCARADACDCAAALPSGELDVAACVEGYRQQCLEAYAPIDAAVAAGDAYVDAEAAAACIALIDAATPGCERPRGAVSLGLCPAWFSSFDAEGEACSFPYCASGDGFCDAGTCVPRLGPGEACDGYECASGLLCVDGTCRGVDGDGVACTDDITCRPPLHCVDGACGELRGATEACDVTEACAQGLICGDASTCELGPEGPCSSDLDCGNLALCATPRRCVTPGGVGSVCSEDAACAPGARCDAATSQCVSYPGLGEDCENGTFCAAGLTCSGDFGQCVTLPGDGEGCGFGPNGPGVCASGLGCNDFICGALPLEGDPCTLDYRCAAGLGCAFTAEGSFCVVPAGVGTECQNDGPCEVGTHCDFATGACALDAARGEPCPAGNECADGDVCGVGSGGGFACVAAPGLGDGCAFDCAAPLVCVPDRASAVCAPAVCLEL